MQSTSKGLKNWQKAIIIILFITIGFVLTLVLTMPSGSKKSSSSKPKTAKVQKISLKQTLLASGTVQSTSTRNVVAKANGTLEKVFVRNGQYVKKGDLIVQIDETQAVYKIEALKRQLLDLELQKQNLERQIQNFTVKSPQDGYVENLSVDEGSVVSQGMQIMTIVDTSKMKFTAELPAWCYGKVKKGQKAQVVVVDFMDKLSGTVESTDSRIYRNQDGVAVFDVKVMVANKNRSLSDGMKASAIFTLSSGENVASLNEGVLEAFSKKIIVSPISGKVEKVFVEIGQQVKQDEMLLQFSTDDIDLQLKQLDLKIEDIKSQIKTAEDDLKEYKISAPIDGKVVDLNLQSGDIVAAGQMICSIYDPKHLMINAQVEELDILKIKPGQRVNIKLDAVASTKEKPIAGYVTEISEKAQAESSISKFTVKIEFENPGNVKVGMHADAEIILKSKNDALVVPVEAVHKENGKYYVYVYTKEKPKTSKVQETGKKTDEYGLDNTYYKDAEKRQVKLGMATDKYVEILYGLKEGEEVVLPKFDSEKQSNSLFY